MTKFSMLKLSLIAAVLTLASTNLHAQAGMTTRVNVPFAFEVGTVHFAPGVYTISRALGNTLSVSGVSATAFAPSLPDSDGKPIAASKVIFAKYGDKYFLRELWAQGYANHQKCFESQQEKQTRAIMASTHGGGSGPVVTFVEVTQ
jgi:hypothetical protein